MEPRRLARLLRLGLAPRRHGQRGVGHGRPFADGRLADPETLPLLAAALWQAGVEGDVALGSGPPLGRFAAEKNAARAALEGRVLRLSDGARERTVRIARLVLRPQGVGPALYLAARGLLPHRAGTPSSWTWGRARRT